MILQLIILTIIIGSLYSLIRKQYLTSAFLFVLMASRGLCIVPESDSGIRLTYGTFIYIIFFILLHKKSIYRFYSNYEGVNQTVSAKKILLTLLTFLIYE